MRKTWLKTERDTRKAKAKMPLCNIIGWQCGWLLVGLEGNRGGHLKFKESDEGGAARASLLTQPRRAKEKSPKGDA